MGPCPGITFTLSELRDDLLDRVKHAVDAAAAVHVDKGEAIGHKVVSPMYDIRLGEEDDGVAVGMSRGKVQNTNIFAIQVYGNVMVEGNNGQGFVRLGLGVEMHGAAIAG